MSSTPDLNRIKAFTKAAWMAGDYPKFATYWEPGALEILAGWAIPSGCRMLDVACGAGQISLPAARAGARVTGIDIATNLVEKARASAASEKLAVQFDEGDMEELPYPSSSFDVVVSMLGVMWAVRPERVAAELVRVCRSGGRIILVNWTPSGLMGQVIEGSRSGRPQATPSPTLWGQEEVVRERLKDGIADLHFARGIYPSVSYPFGPQEVAKIFLRDNGPGRIMFDSLPPEQQPAVSTGLGQLFANLNRATDGTVRLDCEYLETTAIRA